MKFEHANITVPSMEESLRFLVAAFPDCSVRGGGDIHNDPARGRWLHFGNEDFYLALQQNADPAGRSDTTYTNDGVNHLGFVVTELDALLDRLEAAGYGLSPLSVMTGHPYRRRAYVFDRNGMEWEFVEYCVDGAAQRNDYRH